MSDRTAADVLPEDLVTLFDLEARARETLTPMAHAYLCGGSGDEITLRRNRERFDRVQLEPKVLVDVSAIDTRVDLVGQPHAFPILLAPTGYQRLFHPEGEIATTRGAGMAGTTYVASTVATTAIEDIGKAATGRIWFQLYVQRDRSFTEDLVRRALDAGCQAICLTVDTPVLGSRDRERRAGMALPSDLRIPNLRALAPAAVHAPFHAEIYNPFLDATLDWKAVGWLRAVARVPVLLKGILSPADARRAVDEGADGIIVSNHGGRNRDTVPAAIEALPRVVDAVQGRIPVLMDGGVRRGTDVVKALAFGARAVLIGRPYLWGLSCAGAEGVRRAIEILQRELVAAMALCGAPTLSAINRDLIWNSEA